MTADQPEPEVCAARNCDHPPTHGLLCAGDGQRLADHYGAREGHGPAGRHHHGLPWMWEHVQLAYPSVSGWSGSGGRKDDIDDPEAEKLSAVMALRSDIADHLTETAADLAGRIKRHGPQPTTNQRLTVLRTSSWLLANIESLRSAQGITAAADEAVAAVLAEADQLAHRAHTLAPWRAAPTRIDGVPCRCAAVGTMHDHGEEIRCWRCGRTYTPDEYIVLCKVLARRFANQEEATA